MALTGNLKEFNLVNLIQLNCLEKKTAKLTFNYRGKIGVIYFDSGEIPHAQFDTFTGPDAIYRAINLTEGEFKVEDGIRTNIKTIDLRWSELILEGMRIYDESQAGQNHAHNSLIKNILQLEGALAALILLKDGTVLAHNQELQQTEVEAFAAVLSFFAGKMQNVGKNSGLGYFDTATFLLEDKALLLFDRDPDIIGVFLSPKVNLRTAAQMLQREIQNYSNERL